MIPDKITASEARLLRKELAKATKPKKVRKPAEKSAHTKALAKADKYFSLFFRISEADENGRVTCATCGRNMGWQEPDGSSQTGHFMSRGFNATRFNTGNVAMQCRTCNYYLEGNKEKLKAYLTKRHGAYAVARVEATAVHKRLTDFELDAIATEFKAKFEQVKRQKGL